MSWHDCTVMTSCTEYWRTGAAGRPLLITRNGCGFERNGARRHSRPAPARCAAGAQTPSPDNCTDLGTFQQPRCVLPVQLPSPQPDSSTANASHSVNDIVTLSSTAYSEGRFQRHNRYVLDAPSGLLFSGPPQGAQPEGGRNFRGRIRYRGRH